MPNSTNPVTPKLIGRLSLYRRMLERDRRSAEPGACIFSHELAELAECTAALVRRDLMTIGSTGNPKRGYDAAGLVREIGEFLDAPEPQKVALVGVGNLGRALLAFFSGNRRQLPIVAAFDVDPALVGRKVRGCPVYDATRMEELLGEEDIRVGILAVPHEGAAEVAERMLDAGVMGLLNFAPILLPSREGVAVHNIDLTMSLEQVAWFSR